MEDLKDRVAVVTGAASGIGRGIARAFAAKGCHVVVADVDVAGAEQLASELAARGVRSIAAQCDVTDRAALEGLAERAWASFGRVDVLCNNAGVGMTGLVSETSTTDVQTFNGSSRSTSSECCTGAPHSCRVSRPPAARRTF